MSQQERQHLTEGWRPKRKCTGSSSQSDDDKSDCGVTGVRDKGADSSHLNLCIGKWFCNFCGIYIRGTKRTCVDCNAFICEQATPYGPGCIVAGTVNEDEPFRCIICHPRRWRRMHNRPNGEYGRPSYRFTGYGGRKRAKLTWPLVLVTISLATLADRYIGNALALDLQTQYRASPDNLCTLATAMTSSGDKRVAKLINRGVSFVKQSIKSKLPANTFVVLDTHSETETGHLQWGGGCTKPKRSSVSEVVSKFCSNQLLGAMKAAANQARGMKPPSGTEWYDDSAFSRGGWRALLLSTCSPAMRVKDSFEDIKNLVENDMFDFVLGFAGASTIPAQIRNTLGRVIERIGVDKTMSIWDTVMRVVGQDLLLLEVNAVVVVYRERGSSEVMARKIARHSPPLRPWGVEFHACGTPGCHRNSIDFYVQSSSFDVRMVCRFCGWKSAWVKWRHWGKYVFRLDSTLPNVFWHSYPASPPLRNMFVDVTREAVKEGTGAERE